MPRHISIQDVAREAGVGVGTVSRTINHGRLVSPATARAVRRAIARLGYQPGRPGRRPGARDGRVSRGGPTRSVVMFFLGPGGYEWVLHYAPVYASVLHGVESTLTAQRYNLILRHVRDWAEIVEVLRPGQIEGAVILGTEPEAPFPKAARRVPMVWTMGAPRRFPGDIVQPDNSRMGMLAADFLLAQGIRRAAYVGWSGGSLAFPTGFRADQFQWSMREAGGEVLMLSSPDLLTITPEKNEVNETALARLITRLLAAKPRLQAVMLQADMLAPATYRLLEERGVCPMRDLAVVTCNNERLYLNALHPEPAVVDLQAHAIGQRSAEQLLWRRSHPADPPVRILVEPLLLAPQLAPPPPGLPDKKTETRPSQRSAAVAEG